MAGGTTRCRCLSWAWARRGRRRRRPPPRALRPARGGTRSSLPEGGARSSGLLRRVGRGRGGGVRVFLGRESGAVGREEAWGSRSAAAQLPGLLACEAEGSSSFPFLGFAVVSLFSLTVFSGEGKATALPRSRRWFSACVPPA